MTTFYLAGRWPRRGELADKAAELERVSGWRSIGRWLREHSDEGDKQTEAQHDVEDILQAGVFIHMSEPDGVFSTGGRHFEHGGVYIANLLRTGMGMEPASIIVIGRKENVFHHLPGQEHFDTWETFLQSFTGTAPASVALPAPTKLILPNRRVA